MFPDFRNETRLRRIASESGKGRHMRKRNVRSIGLLCLAGEEPACAKMRVMARFFEGSNDRAATIERIQDRSPFV